MLLYIHYSSINTTKSDNLKTWQDTYIHINVNCDFFQSIQFNVIIIQSIAIMCYVQQSQKERYNLK